MSGPLVFEISHLTWDRVWRIVGYIVLGFLLLFILILTIGERYFGLAGSLGLGGFYSRSGAYLDCSIPENRSNRVCGYTYGPREREWKDIQNRGKRFVPFSLSQRD